MKNDIFSLKGKVCIITGGNQGIGKVVAGYIADAGADVVIVDLNDATKVAETIAEEYGVRTSAYVCDVTKPDDVKKCIEAIAQEMGTIDLLFNNAGIVYHEDAETCPAEKWAKVVDVNLNGI